MVENELRRELVDCLNSPIVARCLIVWYCSVWAISLCLLSYFVVL